MFEVFDFHDFEIARRIAYSPVARDFDKIMTADSIRINSLQNREFREAVETYLAKRDPRQKLVEIRASLENIRSALADTFTLSGILLEVGDRKFK